MTHPPTDVAVSRDGAPRLFEENIYGHFQRLEWLRDRLRPSDRALEFGCGTGYFITYPLRLWGYDVTGVDLDETSIRHGQRLLAAAGLPEEALTAADVRDLPGSYDAVIASEVFEHLRDDELTESLALLREKLAPGGRLLVTVPNGYGWFELESLIWRAARFDRLLERLASAGITARVKRVKGGLAGEVGAMEHPMTLAPSPHLQLFTWRSIHETLERAGFAVREARGAVLVCGPFSDLLLSGFKPVMDANKRLGRRLGPVAADFYVLAERR